MGSREMSPRLTRRSLVRAGGGMLLAPAALNALGERAGAAPAQPAVTAFARQQEFVQGGDLTVAIGTDITSLEPQLTTETSSAGVRTNIYDQLVWHFTPDGEIVPWLATEWEAASDGLSYTFTLTDTPVTFHDGTEFNADAVKATFDRIIDPARTGAAAITLDMVESVEVVDPRTVTFTLTNVFAPFMRRIADNPGAIMSPAAIAEYGDDYGQNPIGTGPYQFVEYVTGDHVTLERNPDYWNGPVNFDRITYRIVPEDTARTTLLETNEAQVIDRVTPQLAEVLASNPDVRIQEIVTSRIVYFILNQNRDLMKDVRVRQAVNHAVDRESIIANILRGYAVLADSPVSETVEFYASQTPYAFDPDQARSLLAEAEVAEGTDLVIWTPQGRYVGDRDFATAVQSMMTDVGFNATLETFGDFPAYIEQLNTLEFDMAVWGWANSNEADTALQPFSGDFVQMIPNWGSFDNPEVNDMLHAAAMELDEARRAELYAEVQRIMVEEAAGLLMHWQVNLTGVNQRVDGVYVHTSETLVIREAGFTA